VLPATPPDASSLPALKPNHPSQRRDDPRTARGILCGTIIEGAKSFLLPKTNTAARAPIPALMWMVLAMFSTRRMQAADFEVLGVFSDQISKELEGLLKRLIF
jgi:hypothetical protein